MILPIYIDVAVMSATIEAIVGVAIAVSAFLIIRFRKAKKKVQEALHLEEGGKETEEEVTVLEEVNEELHENLAESAGEAAEQAAEAIPGEAAAPAAEADMGDPEV